MNMFRSQSQSSCQPRIGPDTGESHPGVTVGESRMFQGEGAPSRTPLVPPSGFTPLPHDFRAPQPAPSGRAPPSSAPYAAPRASARQAPRPQPPFGAPPQPSPSGWVPPGPPPPRSRRDTSESESLSSVRDTASARLADHIYEVCPDSLPLFDARAPRCGFEAWFGQPEAAASRQRFRMYPRVAEVQEEVAARSEALARSAKPLSRVIPARARACLYPASGFTCLGFPSLGFRHLLRDGEAGTFVPGSAGGDVLVPLAAVWHLDDAHAGSFSAVRPGPVFCFCCLVTSGAYGCCRLWLPSCQASGELTRPCHSPCS